MNPSQYQILQYEEQQIHRKVFRMQSHQSNQQSQPQLSQAQKFNLKDIPLPIAIYGGTFHVHALNVYFNFYPPSIEQNVRSSPAKSIFQNKRQNKSKQISLNARRPQKQIASSSVPKQIRQGPEKSKKSLKALKQVQNFQLRDQKDKNDLSKEKSKKKCFPSRKGLQKKNMNQFDIPKENISLGGVQKKFVVPISSIKKKSTSRDYQSARNQSYQLPEELKEDKKNEKDVESSSISIASNQKAKTQSRYE